MLLLNKEFLASIGITLDDESAQVLSDHYETTLSDRVSSEIVQDLSPEQSQELSQLKAMPDDQLQGWLKMNVPDLKEIIEDEVAILLGELAENSEQF